MKIFYILQAIFGAMLVFVLAAIFVSNSDLAGQGTETASAGGIAPGDIVAQPDTAQTRAAAAVEAAIQGTLPEAEPGASLGESIFGAIQETSAGVRADAVFDPSTLNDTRRVKFRFDVAPADLLAPGETIEGMGGVEALGRAKLATLALDYCDLVVPKIGTDCALMKINQIVLKNGDLRGTAELAFLPKTEFGRAAMDPAAAYKPFVGAIRIEEHGIESARDDVKRAWHTYFTKAEQACALFRARAGACVIEEIEFTQKALWNDESRVMIKAKARFGVLMAEGSPSEDQLQQAAARVLQN